jgi:hypothetical protein
VIKVPHFDLIVDLTEPLKLDLNMQLKKVASFIAQITVL